MAVNLNSSSASGVLDYQNPGYDDSWYGVRVVLQKETLTVKYCDFPDDDETFHLRDFKDCKELEDFIQNRFRPSSVQLQDNECNKVVQGMTVSAAFQRHPGNVNFYDAVVLDKDSMDHKFEKGEEVCTCKFLLFWLNKKNIGTKTLAKVEDICLLQSENAQTDPTLSLFLKMCREKLKVASQSFGPDVFTSPTRTLDSTVGHKSRSLHCESHSRPTKKRRSSRRTVNTARKLNEAGRSTDHSEKTEQDIVLGGISDLTEDLKEASSYHYILIENLEKGLSPSAIVEFVNKHVSISSQAQLFPSLSSEAYARGVIVVDTQEELQKIADFLHHPAHIILSSRGRPWVPEKKLRRGAVGATVGNLTTLSESKPWDKNLEIGEKIEIFRRGTDEYERGKKLRELFLNFADDQRRLHHLLALDEGKILQPPTAPGKQL